MVYGYKCPECGAVAEVEAPMSTGPPEVVRCSGCRARMTRQYGDTYIISRWAHPWVDAVYKPWVESKEVRENPNMVVAHRQDVFE